VIPLLQTPWSTPVPVPDKDTDWLEAEPPELSNIVSSPLLGPTKHGVKDTVNVQNEPGAIEFVSTQSGVVAVKSPVVLQGPEKIRLDPPVLVTVKV